MSVSAAQGGRANSNLSPPENSSGNGLLTSLVEFIKPVIQAHCSVSPQNIHRNNNNAEAKEAAGNRFILALSDFIEALMQSQDYDQEEKQGDSNYKSQATVPETSLVVQTIPQQVPSTDLELAVLTRTQWHVFNKMPIRLLSFDANGADLKLIGRDQIFSRILPDVFKATAESEFISSWEKLHATRDAHYLMSKDKQEKQNRLLTEAIERNALYAILSHTWIRGTPGDVTYQDWEKQKFTNHGGYSKVVQFCKVAASKHYVTLGWVDSICINKESSAELDESIRSMYNWYRGAHICITFLSETERVHDHSNIDSWFFRGWTLQELLAPRQNVFCNSQWEDVGSANDEAIQSLITRATSITKHELGLCSSGNVNHIPVGRILQLASGRRVTREEDASYSLMGILGVDISIAYGEGSDRAFSRLIQALFKTKRHVLDLFNRRYDKSNKIIPSTISHYSMRKSFFDSSEYSTGTSLDQYVPYKPLLLTHLGLRVPLLLFPALLTANRGDTQYIPLGDFYGTYQLDFFLADNSRPVLYFQMLDRRLFDNNIPAPPVPSSNYIKARQVVMFAVVNFGAENDKIILPKKCLAIPLLCPGSIPGNVNPSDSITISDGPSAVYLLYSEKKRYRVPKDKLYTHGIQLITLYL